MYRYQTPLYSTKCQQMPNVMIYMKSGGSTLSVIVTIITFYMCNVYITNKDRWFDDLQYFIFYFNIFRFSHQNHPRPKHHYVEAHQDFKYVLTWSPGVGHAADLYYYGLPFGFDGFQDCQEPRCYLTSEREQLGDRHSCWNKLSKFLLHVSYFIHRS